MDDYNQVFAAIKLNLKATQLIMRDRRWDREGNFEKSKVLDEQITDIFNPKHEHKKTIQDLTKDALSGQDVQEN